MQIQRERAAAARQRWLRTLAAKKGAATRKRKRLAAVERVVAKEQLAVEVEHAKTVVIEREVERLVSISTPILDTPPKTEADFERRRRAAAMLDEGKKRLFEEERFYPAEELEIERAAKMEVKLGRELVEQAVIDYYEKAKAEGKIEQISRHHKPGTIAKVNYRERTGVVADRRSGELLSERNLEEVLAQMMRAAASVGKRQKNGKLYATFSYFEYGKNHPRSGYSIYKDKADVNKGVVKDELGYFYQSFDATNYLGGASDPASLEIKLRTVLENKLKESAGKNAAVLIGFQMKSYVERSEEERREFDRGVWRRLKKAQRKAAREAAKSGVVGEEKKKWIDTEELERDED